ncbi:MAG: sugar transferase [Catenisphaera adipataccumulans]|jgi:lipopolysaccharide/colanic/teichoic acid biosynthesis glycosyltransferase|uniref:sugar transferase n=1 Tax=Catenisphaera adipataccumulans TaxID=700500 RepID=UPI003D8A1EFE
MNNLSKYNLYYQYIVDLLAITISFWLAKAIKFSPILDGVNYNQQAYITLYFVMIVGYFALIIVMLHNDALFSRSKIQELGECIKIVFLLLLVMLGFAFFTKTSIAYSRSFFILFVGFSVIFLFVFRNFLKSRFFFRYQLSHGRKLIIVGSLRLVKSALEKLKNTDDWRYTVSGLIVTDQNLKDSFIENVKVIGSYEDYMEIIKSEAVDDVFLAADVIDRSVFRVASEICEEGKTVHVQVDDFNLMQNYHDIVNRIGECTVLTYLPIIPIPKRSAALKRLFDIVLGLCLLPALLILCVLSLIDSIFETHGRILVHLIRISRNGMNFRQYRFRTMRIDAQERIKAHKSPYTKFGLFLLWTHLDGMPMILNVLAGEMSFVGPKALKPIEYIHLSAKERTNLNVQAGVVGYWSCKYSDQELIHIERDYIESWNLGKDLLIILKMIGRYITFRSTRKYTKENQNEELHRIQRYVEFKQPLPYDHSLYHARHSFKESFYLFIKRTFDIVLSAIAIVILSPLLLVLMILVVLNDGGSPFYGHERIGKNGKRIKVYKFRSMRNDFEDLREVLTEEQLHEYQTEFKITDDPRITKIGGFLRRTSLDELPQLFNILGGSLSIVGPRPIVEKETKIYGDQIGKLLSVKPGLTGYWQAYARNNATYESGERQKMELYYVDHHSLGFDIKIIFHTFRSVAKEEGAK